MKTLKLQRRLAALALNVGQNKVWFDTERLTEIKNAITKSDIGALVKDKAIKKKPKLGIKRRAGKLRQTKTKKRKRGQGKIKRRIIKRKKIYVKKIRNLRKYINYLFKQEKLTS